MERNLKEKFFCEIIICATNSEINETLYIENNSITCLEDMIIKKIFDFSSKHSFVMPFNYIDDSMSPCFQDKDCQEVYIIFLESNCFSEDDFHIFFDNYMKMIARMKY